MRIYDQDVFEEIFSGNTSHFEFSEHRVKPVRPKTEVDDVPQPLAPHERFLLSSPHSRLVEKYEGGLTGNYLTALMLFGRGTLVAEKFGDWSDGPAKSITSGLSEEAERAVGEAFAAYREAEQIVGAYPLAQQKEADRLRKEHREAKAAAKVKNGVGVEPYMNAATPEAVAHDARLDESFRKVVEATADIAARLDAAIVQEQIASEAWLNAMVRQLLQPAPAQCSATPAPVETAADAVEPARPDQERRLALLRVLGGTAKYTRCEWKFTGIKALVDSEKANGRKRSTEKTIRADLKKAAQNERDESRAGFSDGLGQR